MMHLILLATGVLLNIITVQSQPQWLNHNGMWYVLVGRHPPPGAQPPIAAQVQQQHQQQHHQQRPAANGMISHGNPPPYNAIPGSNVIKTLRRPVAELGPPVPTQPTPPATQGNPTFQRQPAPYFQRTNSNFASQRYPAFPNAIEFPSPLQRPPPQRPPSTPAAHPLAPPPQPQSAIRSWGPVPIWNHVNPTAGYQSNFANNAPRGQGPGHAQGPGYAQGLGYAQRPGYAQAPGHAQRPGHGQGPHHGQQPNIYPNRNQQPYHRAPPHPMYPGVVGSPYVALEPPDVDLRIIACGASALIVTTPALPGASPAEPRCRCEDAQDCDIPSTTQDPLCPLWTTCCCQPLPPTVAPPPVTPTPVVA